MSQKTPQKLVLDDGNYYLPGCYLLFSSVFAGSLMEFIGNTRVWW